ncbi:MAG: AAA family ATPase [Endomicrobium sp.]|jgi:hypothetical protein|nr:AAA family ATPase [Endomicrobium sp.]
MDFDEFPFKNHTFAEIIDKNLVYADKTKYIYRLLHCENKNYFLSRPSRFGKSLLLSTIAELFSGNPERFKDLWIGGSDYDFQKLPVIHLSMSLYSKSRSSLDKSLLRRLKMIAAENNLYVYGYSAAAYLNMLIQKLSKASDSQVVVLIDDCDAPVTRRMYDLEIAKDNSYAIYDFLETLKDPEVSPCVRLSFVTGITRYPLVCKPTASVADHLVDISLDPNYAGICGFTLDDLDSLFSDKLDNSLEELKKFGRMESFTNIEDLKAKINYWYDGYSWGGETRVLNPWTILFFFRNKVFSNYWVQYARPRNLNALIKANPLDFIEATLNLYQESDLKKFDIDLLETIPILFHSGYLTIDKTITNTSGMDREGELSYSLRLPNHEVGFSYYNYIFNELFKPKNLEELKTNGKFLREALLQKNADKISLIFYDFLGRTSFYQRPDGEKNFNTFVQFILFALGFDVKIEKHETQGRLELCFEIDYKVYAIFAIRHVPKKSKLTEEEEKLFFINLAKIKLAPTVIPRYIGGAVLKKIGSRNVHKLLRESPKEAMTDYGKFKLLENEGKKVLSAEEHYLAIVRAVKETLDRREIEEALDNTPTSSDPSSLEINNMLKSSAKSALEGIDIKKYQKITGNDAKMIITLGVSIYGYGSHVFTEFGS